MSERVPEREERVELKEETALRFQFAITFVAAALGSLLLFVLGGSWSPAIWASACMVVYGVLAYRRSPELAETEEFADNFYYLGFLLTLIALVTVLVRMGAEVDDGIPLRTVLASFGLALATTIVGLTGRTYLRMFRRAADETRERAEKRLEEEFERFTRALSRLGAEADAFHQKFGAELETSIEKVRDTVERFGLMAKQSADKARATVQDYDDLSAKIVATGLKLDEGAAQTLSGLERISHQVREINQQVAESSRNAAEGISKTVQAVSAVVDEVRSNVDRLTKSLQTAVASFEQGSRDMSSGLSRTAEHVGNVTNEIVNSVGKLGSDLDRVSTTAERAGQRFESLSRRIDPDQLGLEAAMNSWRGQVAELDQLRSEMIRQSRQSGEALNRVRDELAEAVRFLRETVAASNSTPKDPLEGA